MIVQERSEGSSPPTEAFVMCPLPGPARKTRGEEEEEEEEDALKL